MILSSQGNRPSLSDHRLTHKIADSPRYSTQPLSDPPRHRRHPSRGLTVGHPPGPLTRFGPGVSRDQTRAGVRSGHGREAGSVADNVSRHGGETR